MYQVFPKDDISDHLAYPLIWRWFIIFFRILEKLFIFQESSFWDISAFLMHGLCCLIWPDFYLEMAEELHRDHLSPQLLSPKYANFQFSIDTSLPLTMILLKGRAHSLRLFLYIILNISSIMESFILKWCDATCDVDASLTATQW